MSYQFKINSPYTMIYVDDFFALTHKKEIVITRKEQTSDRYVFKERGKRKEFYMYDENKLNKLLLFEGHDLPLKLDTETTRFHGNALYNFVADDVAGLKRFIQTNCVNLDCICLDNIVCTPLTDRSKYIDLPQQPVFPEEAQSA